jgi:hypothetical protein
MISECKRLIGLENGLVSDLRVSDVKKYFRSFGPNWAIDNIEYHLRVEGFSNRNLIKSVIRHSELENNLSITAQLISNGTDPKLFEKKFVKFKLVKNLRDVSVSETIINREYTGLLPTIDIAYSDRIFEQKDYKIKVKSGSVFEFGEGSCFEGSETIIFKSHECVYVDSLTFGADKIVNFKNDSRIVGYFDNNIYLDESFISGTYDFDTIFWLASPMAHEWGHWINECLVKLSYFYESGISSSTPILISESVPQSFVDLTNLIFPTLIFNRIRRNSRVNFKKVYFVPSRIFGPSNLHWSFNYGPLRVNQEPESSRLVKSHIDKIKIDKIFSEKIFLDRVKTTNRISAQSEIVRQIAISRGYEAIDPGLLNPMEELSLFRYGLKFSGFMGSQFLLGLSSSSQTEFFILHHDAPGDFRGFTWSLEPRKCKWYLGERDIIIPGYGDLISHRVHTSSSKLLEIFAESI